MTARDLQVKRKQWLLGKSLDTFCPMGPWAVTADEVDLSDTTIRCWINGELRQEANTRDLILTFPKRNHIDDLKGLTLHSGDIIATETPAGVGIGFDPPRYLVPGDQVRIEVGGIRVLENPISWAGPGTHARVRTAFGTGFPILGIEEPVEGVV